MADILDDDLLEESNDEQDLKSRATMYLLSMAIGGMIYGRFFGFGGVFTTAVGLILAAFTIMLIVKGLKWMWRKSQGQANKAKYPLWYEMTENTMAFWVWIVALSLINGLLN